MSDTVQRQAAGAVRAHARALNEAIVRASEGGLITRLEVDTFQQMGMRERPQVRVTIMAEV